MVWRKILVSENFEMDQGGTTGCNAYGPPFGLDHKFKNWKTLFSRWINACSHERKQFRLEPDGFGQDFDEWKFWNGPKGRPQDAMHVVPPLILTTSSKIEKRCFLMNKCLFSWKETVSFRIGWFRARFWWVKILKWSKGATTGCNACGPPFGLTTSSKIEKLCFPDE